MTDKVVLLNHKALRTPAVPVDQESLAYVNAVVIPKMIEVMRAEKGMGLAANQIDDPHNVFVLEIEGKLSKFFNAEILEAEGEYKVKDSDGNESDHVEGCLSIPGASAKVPRFDKLKLQFQDELLNPQEVEFTGITAVAIQHEIDHLEGILYIDYLGETTRMMTVQKHQKYVKMRSRMERK